MAYKAGGVPLSVRSRTVFYSTVQWFGLGWEFTGISPSKPPAITDPPGGGIEASIPRVVVVFVSANLNEYTGVRMAVIPTV